MNVNLSPNVVDSLRKIQEQKEVYLESVDKTQDIIIGCINEDEYGKDAFLAIKMLSGLREIIFNLTENGK